MFEKDAEEYYETGTPMIENITGLDFQNEVTKAFQQGAEFSYNKANEWHYLSKGELPRKSDSTLCELMPVFVAVKVGYQVKTYGTYWNLKIGKFECLDEVYSWCYTPDPPELPKESE